MWLCVVLSLVLFIVFYPVLPFTRIPWPLTPTTWKQLSNLTSQVSGSVSPCLAARLVQLLRFTSSYGVPVFLPSPSSGAAVSTLESDAPSVWTDWLLTLPAVSSICLVKLPLSALLHLGLISCMLFLFSWFWFLLLYVSLDKSIC